MHLVGVVPAQSHFAWSNTLAGLKFCWKMFEFKQDPLCSRNVSQKPSHLDSGVLLQVSCLIEGAADASTRNAARSYTPNGRVKIVTNDLCRSYWNHLKPTRRGELRNGCHSHLKSYRKDDGKIDSTKNFVQMDWNPFILFKIWS